MVTIVIILVIITIFLIKLEYKYINDVNKLYCLILAGCPLPLLPLLPLLVLIEFISYLVRNISLGLRLAANILARLQAIKYFSNSIIYIE